MASISQSLKPCIIQLVKDKYPQTKILEIDAIVCVSVVKQDKTRENIVVKIHENDGTVLEAVPCVPLNEGASKEKLEVAMITDSQVEKLRAVSTSVSGSTENFQQVFERAVLQAKELQGVKKSRPHSNNGNVIELSDHGDEVLILDEEPGCSVEVRKACSDLSRQSIKDRENRKRKLEDSKTSTSKYPVCVGKQQRSYERTFRRNRKKRKRQEKLCKIQKLGKKHSRVMKFSKQDKTAGNEKNASGREQTSHDKSSKSMQSKKHQPDETFICEFCNGCYTNGKALRSHALEAHNMKICPICWKSFAFKTRFDAHMKTHSPVYEVLDDCTVSTEENAPSSNVIVVGSYKCGLCGMLFDKENPEMAQQHLSIMHSFKLLLTCVLCKEYFPNETSFAQHRHAKHKNVSKKICSNCCLKFTSEEFSHHQGECRTTTLLCNTNTGKPDSTTVDLTGPPPPKIIRVLAPVSIDSYIVNNNNSQNGNMSQYNTIHAQSMPTVGNVKQISASMQILPPFTNSINLSEVGTADSVILLDSSTSVKDSKIQNNKKQDKILVEIPDNVPNLPNVQAKSVVVLDSLMGVIETKSQNSENQGETLKEIPDASACLPNFQSISEIGSSSLKNIASLSMNPWSVSDIPITDKDLYAQQIQCKFCRFISDTYFAYEEHCRKEHKKYSCNICWETFSSKKALKKHCRNKHSQEFSSSDED